MIQYVVNKNTLAAISPRFGYWSVGDLPLIPPGFITCDSADDNVLGYHMTLLDRADVTHLKQRRGVSNSVVEKWLVEVLATTDLPGTPVCLGVGYAQDGANEAYFEVWDWPEAQRWRRSLGLPNKDLHVTIFYKHGDPHNVRKDASTLVLR